MNNSAPLIRIETGPFPGASYPNWQYTDLYPFVLQDQGELEQSLDEWLRDTGLSEVSFRNDPGGAVDDQVAEAIGRILDGEVKQISLTLWLTVDTEEDDEVVESQDFNLEIWVKRLDQ